MKGTARILYIILGVGAFLSFIGHGLWGATELHDKFPGLLTGSLDTVLGYDMNEATAVQYVQAIGFVDIAVSLVIAASVAGVYVYRDRLATSKVALAVFAWATVWGFATAASRPLHEPEALWPEVLDLVERGPNFLLPAAVLYLIYRVRKQEAV